MSHLDDTLPCQRNYLPVCAGWPTANKRVVIVRLLLKHGRCFKASIFFAYKFIQHWFMSYYNQSIKSIRFYPARMHEKC